MRPGGGDLAPVRSRDRLARRIGGECVAALLSGCVSATGSGGVDVPMGRRPGMVTVLLTPSVRWEPRAREELLDPRIQAAVAACKRTG